MARHVAQGVRVIRVKRVVPQRKVRMEKNTTVLIAADILMISQTPFSPKAICH